MEMEGIRDLPSRHKKKVVPSLFIKTSKMKKLFLLPLSIFFCFNVVAQDADLSKAMEMFVGGTFGKPKIVPKLTKLGIAQVTVNFKHKSTRTSTVQEKKFSPIGKTPGKSATGTVTAYLNFIDEDPTEEDYLEIVNHFYHYLQQSLKKAGIDTVSWEKVSATEFYASGKESPLNDDEDKITYNANNGNTLYDGKKAFAFGKVKKAANFSETLDAPVAFVHATVDFADIMVNVSVKTSGYRSTWSPDYNAAKPVTHMKSKTTVAPLIHIPENSSHIMFFNQKMQGENMNVTSNLPAEMDYAASVTEDPSLLKKKSKAFSVSFSKKLESSPVIISTTREKYIEAAKKALEKMADAMIAKAKA